MAIGDQADMVARMRAVLPAGWFPQTAPGAASATPVLDGVLSGLAWAWAWLFALLAFVSLQTRIATATGMFLDLIALDFFGSFIRRRVNEADPAFSARIRRELFREKATRAGLIAALTDLTGRTPVVFEPAATGDTGGWGGAAAGWTGLAYGAAGGWGSLALPCQFFVTAYRPHGSGIANVAGYYSPMPLGSTDIGGVYATLPGIFTDGPGYATATTGSTDVPAYAAGSTVCKHTLVGAQTAINAGALFPGAGGAAGIVGMHIAVWVPLGCTVTDAHVNIEGAGGVGGVGIDLTIRGEWQTILIPEFALTSSSPAVVVRLTGPSGATLYTSDWRVFRASGSPGGYGVGAIEYASQSYVAGQVLDGDIYAVVNDVRPAGSIAWTAITS